MSSQVSFSVPRNLGDSLDELAAQTGRDRHQLARDWVIERSVALRVIRQMSFWLYDMVEDPVNRKPGWPRKNAVSAGVERLAALIRELEPDYVVGIKTSIEGPVKRAATIAGFPAGQVRILPFPLYQWREEYVRELAKFLRGGQEPAPAAGVADPGGQRLTLHEAMTTVLRDLGGGPAPARLIANEVAARGLYSRRDGSRADYQQLLLRARKYPHLFEISSRGIALARA